MPVLVKLSSTLRRSVPGYDPLIGMEVEVTAGLDVAGLLATLGIGAEEVKIIMLNGRSAKLGNKLRDGDRVGLFPAVGGG